MLPTVAIVGRQNVGKSSILNALAGRRLSIVERTPGVTRDRLEALVSHRGCAFHLVDTGGIGLSKHDPFFSGVEKQIQYAIDHADLILFVVDVQEGPTPLDRQTAERLRRAKRPVILVANKADTPEHERGLGELYALGFGEPFPMAAIHRRRTADFLDELVERLPQTEKPADGLRIAIVGKRNVGKSTLVNALAGEERVIVSEIPGTTRDAVDVHIERNGTTYVLVDTAGLRKKHKLEDAIEFFGRVRTDEAIERADVVVFMIEVQKEVTEVDKRVAAAIEQRRKPCVFALNKYDLIPKGFEPEQFVDYLSKTMPILAYAPIAILSAAKGERVWEVIEIAEELHRQSGVRIPTPQINDALEAAQKMRTPAGRRGKIAKIYYATQKGVHPPRFLVFVNDPRAFAPDYVRYLEGKLREFLPFHEVPIRLELRGKKRKR
ncbi:MAG: ribosome biogenesis GTPase Der [Planctomycetes bacterium]|nr:ribosome biogenesis GTPase Der [Planctomycetota bacterium]